MKDDLLYQRYFDPIKRYLGGYIGESYAEELAQEVFVKVIKGREGFRGDSSIKSWIYRIATNAAKDFLKSRYKKDGDVITESDLEIYDAQRVDRNSPESLNITEEMNDCIKEFVYRLPAEYCMVLILSHLEGHKVKEISELLGESQNTIKVRLHRARAKLKEEMEQGCVIATTCDNRMVCERKE
jgi:RNA polymerase sigma-70 factor, ECF subfamily